VGSFNEQVWGVSDEHRHCRQVPGRHDVGTAPRRSGLIGLAAYMFARSLVDLYGFLNQIVGVAAVPSIVLRVILAAVIVWLIPARNGLQP
jgi:hypothetical protein